MSDSLRPHESQHARPPCPSQTPGVHSDSSPLSQWCHPAISYSVVPFSSCPLYTQLQKDLDIPTWRQQGFWGLEHGVGHQRSALPGPSFHHGKVEAWGGVCVCVCVCVCLCVWLLQGHTRAIDHPNLNWCKFFLLCYPDLLLIWGNFLAKVTFQRKTFTTNYPDPILFHN